MRVAIAACAIVLARGTEARAQLTNPPLAPAGITVLRDAIPFPASRRREMAAYSARHYRDGSWRLAPRVIVLHYTAGPTYYSARATFAHNRAHRGELPGVCAHYVIEQDGTTHEVVDPAVRCRHVVGLNHVALGIEFVQPPAPRGTRHRGRWAMAQIFAPRAARGRAGPDARAPGSLSHRDGRRDRTRDGRPAPALSRLERRSQHPLGLGRGERRGLSPKTLTAHRA